jgi:hypothetical protein
MRYVNLLEKLKRYPPETRVPAQTTMNDSVPYHCPMEYVTLPSMTQDDIETYNQQLKEKREKYMDIIQSFPKNQEEYTSTEWTMYNDYNEINEILAKIKVELVRREEKLGEKDSSELESIANYAYRKIRHMENYDWDVVEHSSEDNRVGFWKQIDSLETLEAAANLEIERRSLQLS